MERKKLLFLTGQYGAGKNTHQETIAGIFGISTIVNMSTLLSTTERTKAYVDAGKLVPDDDVFQALSTIDIGNTCINGFPRTVTQAFYIISKLKSTYDISIVVLDIDTYEAERRMLVRLECNHCKESVSEDDGYQKGQKCHHCGEGSFQKRKDDEIKIIKERILSFKKETIPGLRKITNDVPIHYLDIPTHYSKNETKEFLKITIEGTCCVSKKWRVSPSLFSICIPIFRY